jgi:hypothetical protein
MTQKEKEEALKQITEDLNLINIRVAELVAALNEAEKHKETLIYVYELLLD